jgi:hypothetical protein
MAMTIDANGVKTDVGPGQLVLMSDGGRVMTGFPDFVVSRLSLVEVSE